MQEGVNLGRIFEILGREGVGEDEEEEGTRTRRMDLVRMLRLTKAGSVYSPWTFAGHSFSLPVAFLLSLSLAFASNIICGAGVGGSFVYSSQQTTN